MSKRAVEKHIEILETEHNYNLDERFFQVYRLLFRKQNQFIDRLKNGKTENSELERDIKVLSKQYDTLFDLGLQRHRKRKEEAFINAIEFLHSTKKYFN